MKKALRDLLYADGNRINLERFQKLANGFGQFTTDGIGARGSLSSASGASTASASTRRGEEPLLDRTAVTALKVRCKGERAREMASLFVLERDRRGPWRRSLSRSLVGHLL